jgi:hypothetical protein
MFLYELCYDKYKYRMAIAMNAIESHCHISSGYPILHMQPQSETCSIKIIRQVTILRCPECVKQKITVHNFQNGTNIQINQPTRCISLSAFLPVV